MIVPFEEGHLMKSDFSVVNEDSSNRKRSSSLTEQVGDPSFSRSVRAETLFSLRLCAYSALLQNWMHTHARVCTG